MRVGQMNIADKESPHASPLAQVSSVSCVYEAPTATAIGAGMSTPAAKYACEPITPAPPAPTVRPQIAEMFKLFVAVVPERLAVRGMQVSAPPLSGFVCVPSTRGG